MQRVMTLKPDFCITLVNMEYLGMNCRMPPSLCCMLLYLNVISEGILESFYNIVW